jgi:hypothetical protein
MSCPAAATGKLTNKTINRNGTPHDTIPAFLDSTMGFDLAMWIKNLKIFLGFDRVNMNQRHEKQ